MRESPAFLEWLSCSVSLSHFKNDSAKTKIFDENQQDMKMGVCCGDLVSQHVGFPCCLDKSVLENVSAFFLCQENRNRKLRLPIVPFSFLFFQTVSIRCLSLNHYVSCFSLVVGFSGLFSDLRSFLPSQGFPRLLRFPIRTSARDSPNFFRCHHQTGGHISYQSPSLGLTSALLCHTHFPDC